MGARIIHCAADFNSFADELQNSAPDGVILLAPEFSQEEGKRLASLGVPVVAIGSPLADCSSILYRVERIQLRKLADWITKGPHSNILYIARNQDDDYAQMLCSTVKMVQRQNPEFALKTHFVSGNRTPLQELETILQKDGEPDIVAVSNEYVGLLSPRLSGKTRLLCLGRLPDNAPSGSIAICPDSAQACSMAVQEILRRIVSRHLPSQSFFCRYAVTEKKASNDNSASL